MAAFLAFVVGLGAVAYHLAVGKIEPVETVKGYLIHQGVVDEKDYLCQVAWDHYLVSEAENGAYFEEADLLSLPCLVQPKAQQ